MLERHVRNTSPQKADNSRASTYPPRRRHSSQPYFTWFPSCCWGESFDQQLEGDEVTAPNTESADPVEVDRFEVVGDLRPAPPDCHTDLEGWTAVSLLRKRLWDLMVR